MKKVITVLAILVVLTSAIFAAAPAAINSSLIKIKSTVARLDPAFEFRTKMGSADVTGDVDGEIYTAGDISQEDVTVTFGIYQTAPAKNRFGYSFTITAGKFVQDVAENAYTVDKTVTIGTPTGWYEANDAAGVASIVALAADGNTLTGGVTFSGKDTVATGEKTYFNITWANDREAPHGDYIADVTMAIEIN